jgi:hypothetical protein
VEPWIEQHGPAVVRYEKAGMAKVEDIGHKQFQL